MAPRGSLLFLIILVLFRLG